VEIYITYQKIVFYFIMNPLQEACYNMINMFSMVFNSRVYDIECHVNEVWYDMHV
jgi:hypothetical protein